MDNFAANLHRYPAIQRVIAESDATSFESEASNDFPDFAGGALVGLFESIAQRVGELGNAGAGGHRTALFLR